ALANEMAVVEVLDADEVELKIRVGVQRIGQFLKVTLRQPLIKAAHTDVVRNVGEEGAAVRLLERANAVADAPRQRLLIDVGQQNASGEETGVAIKIEQVLRIQDDRIALLLRREAHGDAAEQPGNE